MLVHKGEPIIYCVQGSAYVAPSSNVEGTLGMSMIWAFKNFPYTRFRVLLALRQSVSLLHTEPAASPVKPVTVGYLSVKIKQSSHNVFLFIHSTAIYKAPAINWALCLGLDMKWWTSWLSWNSHYSGGRWNKQVFKILLNVIRALVGGEGWSDTLGRLVRKTWAGDIWAELEEGGELSILEKNVLGRNEQQM